ncbi:uncharacterized protein LOC142236549 [Haematobia irritans]|uniref:uncharacterized protein LOC142226959 n=1 Tax=Haematobia irritans TaxID=7368 RepID=UPI003F50C492
MAAKQPTTDRHSSRPKGWMYSCGLCKQDHPIKTCHKFLSQGPSERFEIVCQHFYCINCLACSHIRRDCPTKLSCQICNARHNTLLHYAPQIKEMHAKSEERAEPRPKSCVERPQPCDNRPQPHANRPLPREERPSPWESIRRRSLSTDRDSTSQERKSRTPSRPSHSAKRPQRSQSEFKLVPQPHVPFRWSKVLVPTVQVHVAFPEEPYIWHTCRAILNFSATVSRISCNLQSSLHLPTFAYRDTRFAKFRLSGRLARFKWTKEIRALMTSDLPRKPYDGPILSNPDKDFSLDTLADPDFKCNTPIDIELGSDYFADLWRNGSLETNVPGVVAIKTALGYTFSGSMGRLW